MNVKWISHRGESTDAPENTMASFGLSQLRQTDGMECDVHLTKDSRVVISHDPTTERMGNRRCVIAETDFDSLRAIDVSGHFQAYGEQRIPLLEEVISLVGAERQFYIELKPGCPALVPAVAKILARCTLKPSQVVIISFDEDLIALAKREMPQYKALWLIYPSDHADAVSLCEALRKIKADGVDAFANEDFVTKEWIDVLHRNGFSVAVWTVDQPAQAHRLMTIGVDAITSNRAAALRNDCKP